jgi:hypothetical protein
MFLKKDASLVIDLIKVVVPDSLLKNEDIIIAGGAVLHWYFISEMLKNSEPYMVEYIVANSKSLKYIFPYSDIDFWCLKGSEMSKSNIFSEGKDPHCKEYLNFLDSTKDRVDYSSIIKKENGVSNFSQIKSSPWANTFLFQSRKNCGNNIEYSNNNLQFIKKPQDSVEELLNSFDLSIVCCAFHKNEFYINESVLESIKSEQLSYNNRNLFQRKNLGERVFQVIRFFKYFRKTGFSFSEDLMKDVIDTMHDIDDFLVLVKEKKENKENKEDEPEKNFVVLKSSSNYEQVVSSKSTIISMCHSLRSSLSVLKNMKTFEKSNLLFFPKTSIFYDNDLIKELLIDKESE